MLSAVMAENKPETGCPRCAELGARVAALEALVAASRRNSPRPRNTRAIRRNRPRATSSSRVGRRARRGGAENPRSVGSRGMTVTSARRFPPKNWMNIGSGTIRNVRAVEAACTTPGNWAARSSKSSCRRSRCRSSSTRHRDSGVRSVRGPLFRHSLTNCAKPDWSGRD